MLYYCEKSMNCNTQLQITEINPIEVHCSVATRPKVIGEVLWSYDHSGTQSLFSCNVVPETTLGPSKIHMWKTNPQCDGIWRWGLWEALGCEHGTLMNVPTAFIIEAPRELPRPFHHMRTQREDNPSMNPEATPHQILDFQPPRTVGNKSVLFISHPVYGILLQQPKWTKTYGIVRIGLQYHSGWRTDHGGSHGGLWLALEVAYIIYTHFLLSRVWSHGLKLPHGDWDTQSTCMHAQEKNKMHLENTRHRWCCRLVKISASA